MSCVSNKSNVEEYLRNKLFKKYNNGKVLKQQEVRVTVLDYVSERGTDEM
jgi:hypothetical protein